MRLAQNLYKKNQIFIFLLWCFSSNLKSLEQDGLEPGKDIVYFGKIIINGCHKTLPEIVAKNLTFKEGDVWDFDQIEQSLKKLRDLKIFKSVSIVPNDFFQKNARKTTLVNVVEDEMFEVLARVGLTQFSGIPISSVFPFLPALTYTFGGSFLWKNVSGLADIFRLDLDFTRFSTNFAASYKKPLNFYLLPGITLNSKIYNTQVGQPLPGAFNQKAYIEDHAGLLFNFDYEKNRINASFSLGLETTKVSSLFPGLFNSLQIDTEFFKNRVPYLVLEPSIKLNQFDNNIEPTKGYCSSLNLKAVMPLNDLSGSFLRLLFDHSQIMSITNDSLFALRFRVGYIFNQNFGRVLPTERFYLGGLNSIRSYEHNMVPPLTSFAFDQKLPMDGLAGSALARTMPVTYVPIGAKFMINLNTEWRCKLYDKLSGVIFNDIGILNTKPGNFYNFREFSFADLVGTTGFGLRYSTPLGPIRFDVGFKWKKTEQDRPFTWHLTLGQSF